MKRRTVNLRRELGLFDVVSLVVGSIVGADIYVASAFGADLLGPASLIVWIIAGLIAMVIAINFSYCALISPNVGGPYAYARDVKGPFFGFMVGWSLFLAEWASLAVFPVAFTQYFMYFFPTIGFWEQAILKAVFILIITVTNVVGVREAGKTNDILTIGKLGPLLLFVAAGLLYIFFKPTVVIENFTPFIQGSITNFGQALVLIFWAYAGFEISTIPAGEIKDPHKTIPHAIMIGMSIVILFYLISNFVVLAIVPESVLKKSLAPLDTAAEIIFNVSPEIKLLGVFIIWFGALLSITGSNESGMLGTSRLGYALAADGLFPRIFSKIHPKFGTPYLSVIIISVTAYFASLLGGLAFLISASVFFMAFVYLVTSAIVIPLKKKHPEFKKQLSSMKIVSLLGVLFSLYILTQVELQAIIYALMLLAVGVPVYVYFSPKEEITKIKEEFLSRSAVLSRAYEHTEVFLGHFIKTVLNMIRRLKHKATIWVIRVEKIEERKENKHR